MRSFLQQSIRDGSLVGWWDLRRWNQTFLDLSGQGNGASATSNIWWGGGGVQFADANGYIQVADAAELQGTTWTLVALGDWTRLESGGGAASGRLVSKRDAGGTQYEWYLDNTPQMRLSDGAVTRLLALDYRGKRLLATSFTSGATPVVYLDGLLEGSMNDTVTITANDAPLYIGNWYLATLATYNIIQSVLIFNDQLTATEHAQLFGELMALPGGEH
jgi:hypothetical protein